jgi:hypothetical protein
MGRREGLEVFVVFSCETKKDKSNAYEGKLGEIVSQWNCLEPAKFGPVMELSCVGDGTVSFSEVSFSNRKQKNPTNHTHSENQTIGHLLRIVWV